MRVALFRVLRFLTALCCLGGVVLGGQQPELDPPNPQLTSPDYVLGSEDRINIQVQDEEALADKTVRIDSQGEVNLLPRVGRLHAAGLTLRQFEAALTDELKAFLVQPHVSVSLVEGRSQPVSILGSVGHPGVFQLQGEKTLLEMITLAGGLAPDAGYSARIIRKLKWGRLPIPGALDDSSGQYSIGTVNLQGIIVDGKLEQNIRIKPEDAITVPRAEIVYVLGEVAKTGGYVLADQQPMMSMQAIALAGGFQRTADQRSAKILRPVPGSPQRTEVAVNLKDIFDGKAQDVQLLPQDILYVPTSVSKRAASRTLETLLAIGTSVATYGIIYRPSGTR